MNSALSSFRIPAEEFTRITGLPKVRASEVLPGRFFYVVDDEDMVHLKWACRRSHGDSVIIMREKPWKLNEESKTRLDMITTMDKLLSEEVIALPLGRGDVHSVDFDS